MDQLQKTLAQISILELLKLSPNHKEILQKSLLETNIPIYLEEEKFQNMVGHLITPHCLSFSEQDDMSITHPQNFLLHIEFLIQRHRVKRFLIDGGASLNICTLNLVKSLGLSKSSIDPKNQITIKSYDEEERSSKGMIILPIQVGPIKKDTICQVLYMNLSYKILLGRPWIHEMQAVPSTYHQCIKFPHMGEEITIGGDSNPFQYCSTLKPLHGLFIPHNSEGIVSNTTIE